MTKAVTLDKNQILLDKIYELKTTYNNIQSRMSGFDRDKDPSKVYEDLTKAHRKYKDDVYQLMPSGYRFRGARFAPEPLQQSQVWNDGQIFLSERMKELDTMVEQMSNIFKKNIIPNTSALMRKVMKAKSGDDTPLTDREMGLYRLMDDYEYLARQLKTECGLSYS